MHTYIPDNVIKFVVTHGACVQKSLKTNLISILSLYSCQDFTLRDAMHLSYANL